MSDLSERSLLQTSGLLTAGAVLGLASTVRAQSGFKTPLQWHTTVFRWLVLMMFPVLPINCTGRNDAAHAREMVGG